MSGNREEARPSGGIDLEDPMSVLSDLDGSASSAGDARPRRMQLSIDLIV
jgi:hypothetical protein